MHVPEKRTVKKYGRTEVRIDDKYIETINRWLTDRDLRILKLLNRYPFMTIDQIEMMVFGNLKPSCWRTKANERIRRLYHAHCIDRWFPPVADGTGSAPQHLILDRAGARILALKGEPDMENWRKRDYVPQTYSHTLKLYDFRAMLSLLTRQDDFIVKEWILENKNKMQFPIGDGKQSEVIPDAMCQYIHNKRQKAFFLECDNGTMSDNQLKSKIQRYIHLYKSEEWKKTKWARELRAFPPVVIIMHSQDDILKLNDYVNRIKSSIRFMFATYSDLKDVDCIVYENSRGKIREVPQSVRVRLLDPIFICGEGKVPL
jgi:hypothetical protein